MAALVAAIYSGTKPQLMAGTVAGHDGRPLFSSLSENALAERLWGAGPPSTPVLRPAADVVDGAPAHARTSRNPCTPNNRVVWHVPCRQTALPDKILRCRVAAWTAVKRARKHRAQRGGAVSAQQFSF